MTDSRKRLLSNQWWAAVWAIVTVLTLLVYPGSTSYIAGWFPVSILTNYGMMIVIFVVAVFFTRDMLDFD